MCVHEQKAAAQRTTAQKDGEASADLLNKVTHLIAFGAQDSSLYLPVTPVQLMRPGIG